MCEHHDNTAIIMRFDETKPNETNPCSKKSQDYLCLPMLTECTEILWKYKKHYLEHKNKVNENKVLSYCEALRYIYIYNVIQTHEKVVHHCVKLTTPLSF